MSNRQDQENVISQDKHAGTNALYVPNFAAQQQAADEEESNAVATHDSHELGLFNTLSSLRDTYHQAPGNGPGEKLANLFNSLPPVAAARESLAASMKAKVALKQGAQIGALSGLASDDVNTRNTALRTVKNFVGSQATKVNPALGAVTKRVFADTDSNTGTPLQKLSEQAIVDAAATGDKRIGAVSDSIKSKLNLFQPTDPLSETRNAAMSDYIRSRPGLRDVQTQVNNVTNGVTTAGRTLKTPEDVEKFYTKLTGLNPDERTNELNPALNKKVRILKAYVQAKSPSDANYTHLQNTTADEVLGHLNIRRNTPEAAFALKLAGKDAEAQQHINGYTTRLLKAKYGNGLSDERADLLTKGFAAVKGNGKISREDLDNILPEGNIKTGIRNVITSEPSDLASSVFSKAKSALGEKYSGIADKIQRNEPVYDDIASAVTGGRSGKDETFQDKFIKSAATVLGKKAEGVDFSDSVPTSIGGLKKSIQGQAKTEYENFRKGVGLSNQAPAAGQTTRPQEPIAPFSTEPDEGTQPRSSTFARPVLQETSPLPPSVVSHLVKAGEAVGASDTTQPAIPRLLKAEDIDTGEEALGTAHVQAIKTNLDRVFTGPNKPKFNALAFTPTEYVLHQSAAINKKTNTRIGSSAQFYLDEYDTPRTLSKGPPPRSAESALRLQRKQIELQQQNFDRKEQARVVQEEINRGATPEERKNIRTVIAGHLQRQGPIPGLKGGTKKKGASALDEGEPPPFGFRDALPREGIDYHVDTAADGERIYKNGPRPEPVASSSEDYEIPDQLKGHGVIIEGRLPKEDALVAAKREADFIAQRKAQQDEENLKMAAEARRPPVRTFAEPPPKSNGRSQALGIGDFNADGQISTEKGNVPKLVLPKKVETEAPRIPEAPKSKNAAISLNDLDRDIAPVEPNKYDYSKGPYLAPGSSDDLPKPPAEPPKSFIQRGLDYVSDKAEKITTGVKNFINPPDPNNPLGTERVPITRGKDSEPLVDPATDPGYRLYLQQQRKREQYENVNTLKTTQGPPVAPKPGKGTVIVPRLPTADEIALQQSNGDHVREMAERFKPREPENAEAPPPSTVPKEPAHQFTVPIPEDPPPRRQFTDPITETSQPPQRAPVVTGGERVSKVKGQLTSKANSHAQVLPGSDVPEGFGTFGSSNGTSSQVANLTSQFNQQSSKAQETGAHFTSGIDITLRPPLPSQQKQPKVNLFAAGGQSATAASQVKLTKEEKKPQAQAKPADDAKKPGTSGTDTPPKPKPTTTQPSSNTPQPSNPPTKSAQPKLFDDEDDDDEDPFAPPAAAPPPRPISQAQQDALNRDTHDPADEEADDYVGDEPVGNNHPLFAPDDLDESELYTFGTSTSSAPQIVNNVDASGQAVNQQLSSAANTTRSGTQSTITSDTANQQRSVSNVGTGMQTQQDDEDQHEEDEEEADDQDEEEGGGDDKEEDDDEDEEVGGAETAEGDPLGAALGIAGVLGSLTGLFQKTPPTPYVAPLATDPDQTDITDAPNVANVTNVSAANPFSNS